MNGFSIRHDLLPPMKCDGAHDRRPAGIKGKCNSPWRHGNVDTPATRARRAQWEREGSRRK